MFWLRSSPSMSFCTARASFMESASLREFDSTSRVIMRFATRARRPSLFRLNWDRRNVSPPFTHPAMHLHLLLSPFTVNFLRLCALRSAT